MGRLIKSQKLLDVAGKTLDNGDRASAKKIAVMALRQEDAVDALDRLLPSVPEPDFNLEEEEENLSESQISRIMTVAQELHKMRKFRVATQLIAKIEKIEEGRKRKKKIK